MSVTPILGYTGKTTVRPQGFRAGGRRLQAYNRASARHFSPQRAPKDAKKDESYEYTGEHLSVYDRTKAQAHAVAKEQVASGLPLVIVQPGIIYGPGDTSALRTTLIQYLRRRQMFMPQGTAYCWAHVDDVAHAHLLAMEKGRPGETYIIAGPCHTLTEFFELAAELTGVPAPTLRIPAGMIRATAGLMGVVEKVLPVPVAYTREYLRENGGTTYLGDNAKARRELGYNPRSLREGMEETLRVEMELLRKG